MRLSRCVAVCAILVVMLFAASDAAQAGNINQKRVTGYYGGSGGEFTVYNFTLGSYITPTAQNVGAGGNGLFETFCVETDEFAVNGTFTTSNAADNGGWNTNSGDFLGDGSKWLFNMFWFGDWSDTTATYDYTVGVGRAADAVLLQQALWYLEDENPAYYGNPATNKYVSAAVTKFGSVANAKAETLGYLSDVLVINVRDITGKRAQDFLVVVPLPSAVWAGLMLLGGVGLFRTVRRKRY